MRNIPLAIALIFYSAGMVSGQVNNPAGPETDVGSHTTFVLMVPRGAPLPVVLDKEVRIQKEGQPIHGKIAEPVYAFDKLVIPAGSEVTGRVMRIADVSRRKRAIAALDSNFSPPRDVEITFDQLTLPDGQRVSLRTHVSPASQGVLQFATAPEPGRHDKNTKQNAAVKLASETISEK
jgi:hypothetical protein